MATYSTSEITKQRLIMAAGELFAQNGIKAVTVRAIAKKAGENLGLIKYHFGGKAGLLDAVVDFATMIWQSDPLGKYLAENERLFESVEGQERLVGGLIALFFDTIFAKGRPVWCGVLMSQILQHDLPASNKVFDSCAMTVQNAFFSVFKRITGDEDMENSLCWILIVTAPAHILSIVPSTLKKIHKSKTTPDSLVMKLRDMTIRSALANLRVRRTERGNIIFKD